MTGFSQLVNGLLVFDALVLLDKNYFIIWEKDLFKNTGHLSEAQLQTACNNNWQIVYKSFTTWLEKESFHDSYFDLSIEQILAGDPGEYFGYFENGKKQRGQSINLQIKSRERRLFNLD